MSYLSRISDALTDVPIIPVDLCSRCVLISDCHRGIGNNNDNFLKNQNLYFAALQYYYQKKFTYIELGDGDELWENREINTIMSAHSNVFWLLSLFEQRHQLYMIYGNHDLEKAERKSAFCFPAYSGLVLYIEPFSQKIYLTHGHQAECLNSTFWHFARFLVRYLWKPAEKLGVLDPTSAAKNYTIQKKTERRLQEWAELNQSILITGHTHRPTLEPNGVLYFNTGSCVHPRCITCIEITNLQMTLVKWSVTVKPDRSLYVARTILSGPIPIYIPNY